MSLFTLKEVWSVGWTGEGGTSVCHKALCIGNVDNEGTGGLKVLLGTSDGILRIFGTAVVPAAEDEVRGLKGLLLAELNLGVPILQVETGYFVGGSNQVHLSVLHPQKLGVYAVTKVSGQVEHGSQYKVTLLYEHQLKRLAFNMVVGPFGQSKTSLFEKAGRRRDFMCVQALDGTLSFFEQEVFSFSRYLPDFLIPGPLAFNPATSSFLTLNSSWDLQSFRYSALAMAKEDSNRQTEDQATGNRLSPDWTVSAGEDAVGDIQVLIGPEDQSRILLLTFRHLFCWTGAGELLCSKRLDYPLTAFTAFLNGSGEVVTIAASGNDPSSLYVYLGTSLKWAARLPFSPAYVGRVSVQDVEGGILLLSPEGKLSVSVLGTEPSLFIAPPVHSRDLDYEAAEKELHALRKIIAEAGDQNIVASKDAVVEVKVEFEGQKTKWAESSGLEVIALIATVKIMCHVRVNDVRVSIYTPKPIVCSLDSVYIGDIVGRHSYTVEFETENEAIPSDLQVEVHVVYLNEAGAPHYISKGGIKIPLFIVTRPEEKVDKEGEAKLTFTLNKPLLNLVSLYNDFEWAPDVSPAGLTFRLCGGERVTLLSSTKGNTGPSSRYRIQSDSIAAIHLVFRDFLDRLQRMFGREKDSFDISLGETEIPLLAEYFQELDAHVVRRRREAQIKEDLAGRAAQLRAIQRKLLLRFRDKNAIPLTQLETLLDGSIEQIIDGLNFMEQNELEMAKSECRLSGGTRLMLELCLLQGGRSADEIGTLSSALCPYLWDFVEERGWEEVVYSALSFIKSNQVVPVPTFSQLDPAKLKKVIKVTLERIRKAAGPLLPSQTGPERRSAVTEKLVGNEIVERMASARARTGRKRNAVLPSIPEPVDGELDRRSPTPPAQLSLESPAVQNGGPEEADPVTQRNPKPLSSPQHSNSDPLINIIESKGTSVSLLNSGEAEEAQEDAFW